MYPDDHRLRRVRGKHFLYAKLLRLADIGLLERDLDLHVSRNQHGPEIKDYNQFRVRD